MYILILQKLMLDALVDLLYFPFWWYGGGSRHAFKKCLEYFKHGNEFLAPSLWLQNIFVPMFGQYDWQGRIISFFMRLFQVAVRSLGLFFWLLICLALLLFWLVFPVIIIYGIIISFRK